jgi:hypothetical protein
LNELLTISSHPLLFVGFRSGRLKEFRARTNQVPKRIIFFRDGVGEGMFKEVSVVRRDWAIRCQIQALKTLL